jgi:hypothetical protein
MIGKIFALALGLILIYIGVYVTTQKINEIDRLCSKTNETIEGINCSVWNTRNYTVLIK